MNKKRLQGRFIERVMAHRYRLDEYSKEELVKIYMALNEAEKGILRLWDVSTEWSRTRARRLLKVARGIMDGIKPRVGESLADLLGEVSASSSRAYSDMLSLGGRAGAVRVALLSAEQMRSFWRETPVGGRLLEDWVGRVFDGPTVDAVQRQVFAGMFEGEGFREMAKRLRDGFVTGRREAETLVHTYVQTANVHAMEEVYRKNRDVVAGVRWLTAFDKRTCLRCAALSGKLYPLDEHPDCPCHPRCRCVLIPETDIGKLKVRPKIAEDWAKDLKKKPPGLETVLTPDGIPRTDFRSWIMAQPEKDQLAFFGKKRYALLKEGKIDWDDLVEETGSGVRLRLMEELQGDLDKLRKKMEALEDARHKAMAAGLDERAFAKAMQDAARAAELFEEGEAVRAKAKDMQDAAMAAKLFEEGEALGAKAKAIGGKALEKITRHLDLVSDGYLFDGVDFTVKNKKSLAAFTTHEGKFKLHVNPNAFSADVFDANGEVRTVDFSPAKGLFTSLKKIYGGEALTFHDEAYLQATLHHEIQHSRQQIIKSIGDKARVYMEIVNEWTSRRNYPELLRKLGVEPAWTDAVKKEGYGYGYIISNFDTLLKHLDIEDGADLLYKMNEINQTKEWTTHYAELRKLLKENRGKNARPLPDSLPTVMGKLDKLGPNAFRKWLEAGD